MVLLDRFEDVVHSLRANLLGYGIAVSRGEWQSMTDDRPQTRVLEVYNQSFQTPVPMEIDLWQRYTLPNLPWAEDHLQERIGGQPLNPGEQYQNWPWYEQGVEEHKLEGEFSHTYMERIWSSDHQGIRFQHGDLWTLVELLRDRPFTRQAYLPIWFPEDLTAAHRGHRVPCTLGYHFMMQPHADVDSLHIFYPMRSCDFFRYLRDDAYMAGRLLQHVVHMYNERSPIGRKRAETGRLTMHIANLHIFEDEYQRLETEHREAKHERLKSL